MSLGYFFANSKPIQQDLLGQMSRPEKIWLRDLMLVDQKNIILLTQENRLAQSLIQSACNDLRLLALQEVFHFDFHRFLALAHSPVDANRLFDEFLDDLSHTKANTWIYIQNLDDLLLHDDPSASALVQNLLRANYVSQCRLIVTMRDRESIGLIKEHFSVFYHHAELLKLGDVTRNEVQLLLTNAVRRLQRQYNFSFEETVIPKLLTIVSRYAASEGLLTKALEIIKIAVARMEATRANKSEAVELSLQLVLQVLSDWQQIPLTHLLHDVDSPELLEEFLLQKVMGQEAAVAAIVAAAQADTTSLLVFHGPEHSGKTRMAAALARYYNGAERYLVQIDVEQHSGRELVWECLYAQSPAYVPRMQPLLSIIKENPHVVLGFRCREHDLEALAAMLAPLFQHDRRIHFGGEEIDFSGVTCVLFLASNQLSTQLPSANAANTADDLLRLVCDPDLDEEIDEPEEQPEIEGQSARLVLPPVLQSIATLVSFNSTSDVTIKALVQKKLRDYCSQMEGDHQVRVTYQDEVVDYLLQQVLRREQGTKAIGGVFQEYLYPAVEKSVVCVDQSAAQQMLVLMLNDTGQLLMGQLMPLDQEVSH